MKNSTLLLILFFQFNAEAQNSFSLNKIISDLNLNSRQCKRELIVSKVSPENPDETIVVIPEIAEGGEYYFELNSHILITDSNTGEIKYKYFESSKTNNWHSNIMKLDKITIDTSAFFVGNSNRAFGIRVHYISTIDPKPVNYETLSLFIKGENEIQQILRDYKVKETNGEWDNNCHGDFMEQSKILIIGKSLTNDFFDIIVKNNIVRKESFMVDNNICEAKKVTLQKEHILKYDQGVYK